MRLAPIHSLTEILCLAQQAGTLTENQAAQLFGAMVERFQRAASSPARVQASLDTVREILARAGITDRDGRDAAMRRLVLGVSPSARDASYQQVVELQKVPSLETLMTLYDAVRGLAAGDGLVTDQIQLLLSRTEELPNVDVPLDSSLAGEVLELTGAFQPHRMRKVIKQLQHLASQTDVGANEAQRIAG